jgi:hypothetical protein
MGDAGANPVLRAFPNDASCWRAWYAVLGGGGGGCAAGFGGGLGEDVLGPLEPLAAAVGALLDLMRSQARRWSKGVPVVLGLGALCGTPQLE